tara:strand:- start:513 stop:1553 length:1041 start_codon:yes stop_codon:yes gene_type:complete
MLHLAQSLALSFAASQGSQDVVMYHVNPRRFGPVPLNMDTADEAGDLFFEMMQVLPVPLACSDPHRDPHSGFECENPEAIDPTDVVNKLTLTVEGGFSGYAMCNIGRNDTDGIGHACKDDTYCCFCPGEVHSWPPVGTPCNATVGMSNIHESHMGHSHGACKKDYECYSERAGEVLTAQNPGYWYSPLSYGACSLHTTPASNCTWSVKAIEKIVNKTCHADSFFGAIQAAAPSCFSECASPKVNSSDPCWVRCFYSAVLGPNAGKPFGKVGGGLPLEQVLGYWRRPFESDDPAQGGCPGLPVPSLEEAERTAEVEAAGRDEKRVRLSQRQKQWRTFSSSGAHRWAW